MRKFISRLAAKVVADFTIVTVFFIGVAIVFLMFAYGFYCAIELNRRVAGVLMIIASILVLITDLELIPCLFDGLIDLQYWLEDKFLEMHPIKKIKEMIKNAQIQT